MEIRKEFEKRLRDQEETWEKIGVTKGELKKFRWAWKMKVEDE